MAEPLTDEGGGGKPAYQEKTPGDELQKMPHAKARRFKLQARLEPKQQHWWPARKVDVLTITPRAAPTDNDNKIILTVIIGKQLCKKTSSFYGDSKVTDDDDHDGADDEEDDDKTLRYWRPRQSDMLG